jgi:hypothetical protein
MAKAGSSKGSGVNGMADQFEEETVKKRISNIE